MKKIFILFFVFVIVSIFIYGTSFSWEGEMRTRSSNYKFLYYDDSKSVMDTRVRLYTTATMSDNLKAVVGFEIGDFEWGNDDHNADYENVEVKNAYLEFSPDMIDMLTFRVGLQSYADPFGSAVFDEDAAGIMVMPEFDGFNMKAGFFVLEDDDVENDSHTFGIIDMSKEMDALSLKGSFYYNTIRESYTSIYLGAGVDYMINDDLGVGGHFLYMSWKLDPDIDDYDAQGYFGYLYGEYTMDKFSAKVNFGYTPADNSMDDPVFFNGVQPYPYLYGLEYFFPGDVYDKVAAQWGYGSIPWMGSLGSMVLSANLKYDFLFANIGFLNTTAENYDKSNLGTEIDFGIDYDLTEKLNFKAVYVMFSVGEFYETYTPADNDSAYELSTQLIYKF